MKQASVRLATALAHNVLPVPGGPKRRIPFGGSMPRLTNLSGYKMEGNFLVEYRSKKTTNVNKAVSYQINTNNSGYSHAKCFKESVTVS